MGRQDDKPAPEEEAGAQGWELLVENCRISLWSGYLTSAFYARATGDSIGTPIGKPSTAFRWRRSAAPDTQEARLAHYELVSRLKEDGWTQAGRGDKWYETEFARPVLVPSHEPTREALQGEASPLPERELEPEAVVPPLGTAPRVGSHPEWPVPAATPGLAATVEASCPSARPDPWRAAAAAGLVTAIALLGWVAAHASAIAAAAPLRRPTLTATGPRSNLVRTAADRIGSRPGRARASRAAALPARRG